VGVGQPTALCYHRKREERKRVKGKKRKRNSPRSPHKEKETKILPDPSTVLA
jgi:hypothetical protein